MKTAVVWLVFCGGLGSDVSVRNSLAYGGAKRGEYSRN